MPADNGIMTGPAHCYRVRIYYEDTDAGGIVYHANYLKFAERARTEFLRRHGIAQDRLRQSAGVGFTVRYCAIDYRAPARLDDLLEVRTMLHDLRGARAAAVQCIHLISGDRVDEVWLARLDLVLACINQEGRPVRWPASVVRALAAACRPDSAKGH